MNRRTLLKSTFIALGRDFTQSVDFCSAAIAVPGTPLGSVGTRTGKIISVKDRGAIGDGTTDDTAAIQAAINMSEGGGTLLLPRGTYKITSDLNMTSNITVIGDAATITCSQFRQPDSACLQINGKVDVEIRGLSFDAQGRWTSSPFENPYQQGKSVGFTNSHVGVRIYNKSHNVKVYDCSFKNTGIGILGISARQCQFRNNQFDNCGSAAIHAASLAYSLIANNKIRRILGNMTAAGTVDISNSMYADGIYLYGCNDTVVAQNQIDDCVRIGIVLEGDGITKNKRITVVENKITNMNSCRGSEFNAGIWSEVNKSERSIDISGNILDNKGAVQGTHGQHGIEGHHATVSANKVANFSLAGITGADFEVKGNTVATCGVGILVYQQSRASNSSISANTVVSNAAYGIGVELSRGAINLRQNEIVDNGSRPGGRICGMYINGFYDDQELVIEKNNFVSSANEGDKIGQVYGILAVGADATRIQRYSQINNFVFKGTLLPRNHLFVIR